MGIEWLSASQCSGDDLTVPDLRKWGDATADTFHEGTEALFFSLSNGVSINRDTRQRSDEIRLVQYRSGRSEGAYVLDNLLRP